MIYVNCYKKTEEKTELYLLWSKGNIFVIVSLDTLNYDSPQ